MNITASMVRCYKSCQQKFKFSYIDLLKPVKTSEALETGSQYHECIEHLLLGEEYTPATPLVGCMARAFEKQLHWQQWDIAEVEHEFKIRLKKGLYLIGKFDGLLRDGSPVEHKTTANLNDQYVARLAWDEQVTIYLMALNLMLKKPVDYVQYTVCQKPTIRLKQNENESDYYERVNAWYDENLDKVQSFKVRRSINELRDKYVELLDIAHEIKHRKMFHRNPNHCMQLHCEFSSICLDYQSSAMVNFVKKEKQNEELEVF